MTGLQVLSDATSWKLAAVAVPGRRHLAAGEPCQDAFCHASFDTPDGEALVAALADGAGSASRAAEGANLAAGMACDIARTSLVERVPSDGRGWQELAERIVGETMSRLARVAVAIGEPRGIAALGSTLTLALIRLPWVCLVSIGDSLAIIVCQDDSAHLLEPLVPAHPDGDPTHTLLTSSGPAEVIARIAVVEDGDIAALMLASDGLASAILNGDRPHPDYVHPLLDQVRSDRDPVELASYLMSDTELVGRSGDDRSLLIAVRR
jgi:hypothetical protein